MSRSFHIGGVGVGADHPPVFFAEIGSFFNGDAGLARDMIGRVIDCRDAVPQQPMILKTEILDDPEICLPGDAMETYASKDGEVRVENYRALIERKVMALELYAPLFRLCTDRRMPFVVSVYDFRAADFAAAHGASGLKIASSNVVHVPLIRHVARLGLPMIIDTRGTSIAEVHRAIDVARTAGCQDIVVQHSPDGHPAPPKGHNLRILQTFAQAFGLPTGLSDHYVGVEMMYVAIALGASVLEKGVYMSPDELDQDISHTMGLAELPQVLQRLNDCWVGLGKAERDVHEKIDWVLGTSQRQGLVARRDLAPGDPVSLDTMRFAFPCLGIPVQHWDLVEGWSIVGKIAADQPIRWDDVRPRSV